MHQNHDYCAIMYFAKFHMNGFQSNHTICNNLFEQIIYQNFNMSYSKFDTNDHWTLFHFLLNVVSL